MALRGRRCGAHAGAAAPVLALTEVALFEEHVGAGRGDARVLAVVEGDRALRVGVGRAGGVAISVASPRAPAAIAAGRAASCAAAVGAGAVCAGGAARAAMARLQPGWPIVGKAVPFLVLLLRSLIPVALAVVLRTLLMVLSAVVLLVVVALPLPEALALEVPIGAHALLLVLLSWRSCERNGIILH